METVPNPSPEPDLSKAQKRENKIKIIQGVLFLATLVTTTLAGAEWTTGKSIWAAGGLTWVDVQEGLPYSLSFLFILSVHEFGHYFLARHHGIKTSLPYYIPLPPLPLFLGTLGALIRIRQRIPTTLQNFDVGVAGPLAGFAAAVLILIYGFVSLPPAEHIFSIHPGYEKYGLDYANHVYTDAYLREQGGDMFLGQNILFVILAKIFADPARLPNVHELMHYPYLFAGFLSLVFTALNLLPIGQLDGGHVVYGMFGRKVHRWVAGVVFVAFVAFAGLGVVTPRLGDNQLWHIPMYIAFLYLVFTGLKLDLKSTLILALSVFLVQYLISMYAPTITGYQGWLLFAFLLGRVVGVQHPGAEKEVPLDFKRKIIGWLALLILILCFTPYPLTVVFFAP